MRFKNISQVKLPETEEDEEIRECLETIWQHTPASIKRQPVIEAQYESILNPERPSDSKRS